MVKVAPPRQLALALAHGENFAREDFLAGPPNAHALAMIERWPDWPHEILALVGPEGSGKSHLAAIWAELAGARFLAARSLGDSDIPANLSTGALVLEDLASGAFEERALFHLLNLARETHAFVLITAQTAPVLCKVTIADLGSRLRALPTVEIAPPDDALLRAVLVKLFADRQLTVDEAIIIYISTRIERSFAAARAVVAELDREALRRQRPVTRLLAAEILATLSGPKP